MAHNPSERGTFTQIFSRYSRSWNCKGINILKYQIKSSARRVITFLSAWYSPLSNIVTRVSYIFPCGNYTNCSKLPSVSCNKTEELKQFNGKNVSTSTNPETPSKSLRSLTLNSWGTFTEQTLTNQNKTCEQWANRRVSSDSKTGSLEISLSLI